ncbi:MAG TPA: hypothetical protein VM658_14325 [bacterium]|nr:hypothetical protein [bacterium]
MNTASHSKNRGFGAAAWVLAAAIALSVFACKDKGPKETPQERAKREIISSLILPPDSALRGTEVKPEMDMFILQYGTNQDTDALVKFYRQQIMEKKYTVVAEGDSGVTYQDDKSRSITVMWFSRDPDLSEYKTVFSVAVNPLPPELKKAAP